MLKQYLNQGIEGQTFTESEAEEMMDIMMTNQASDAQIASLLTLLRMRGETVEELVGFTRSMRKHALSLPESMQHTIDTCGTGGDHASTFNISTTAAIVLSAMGVKVAKHGNRSVSSKSGSADVLEHLNIPIQSTPEEALQSIEQNHLCFLYAPFYHCAMKNVAVPRKEVGFRSIFNILGPLANPANSKYQVIGATTKQVAEKMAHVIAKLGVTKALIVSGQDGLDECSITTLTDVFEIENGSITEYTLDPEEVGLERGKLADIRVKSPAESSSLVIDIMKGKANPSATNIVILNTGVALYTYGKVDSIAEGVHRARQAILSGEVYSHYLKMTQKEAERYA